MVRLVLPHRLSSHLGSKTATPVSGLSRNASPVRMSDAKPLILKISVIKGRNLAAKDRSGTSDPYLVITLGDTRESTPTIPKTLNPEWNVAFEVPVVGVPLLECVCWDRDRLGKDYMGEFDIALEDIFTEGEVYQQPKWYTLKSKRKPSRRKGYTVSGEILLEFSLADPSNLAAAPGEVYQRFRSLAYSSDDESEPPETPPNDSDDIDQDDETSNEADDPTQPEAAEKRRKRLRLRRLKRRSLAARAYQFSGADNGVEGIVFIEIIKITDLPPERNVTRTSFDMDPFVVTSLGRKTLRTPVIRHNLNPIYNEKMVFQVMRHEQLYTIGFTVMDRDKFSGNDFVASAEFPLQTLIQAAPVADPETGLYRSIDLTGYCDAPAASKLDVEAGVGQSPAVSGLVKSIRPGLVSRTSSSSLTGSTQAQRLTSVLPVITLETETAVQLDNPTGCISSDSDDLYRTPEADSLKPYTIALILKNKERWEDRHFPELFIKAKYMPYSALRQRFWRLMLRQYDADDSGRINKVEMTTMLDTLGSTLKESTIDGFFDRFRTENSSDDTIDLTFDQAVICLEDTLRRLQQRSITSPRGVAPAKSLTEQSERQYTNRDYTSEMPLSAPENIYAQEAFTPAILGAEHLDSSGEDLQPDDLGDEQGEERIIEIRECPICHQPQLAKRTDTDIITHIATCASRDWRQVDNLVMGGFVTSSQAQRKWYTKVITKISYGGYRLGANSANILVQDRITGQISEERMSVYVRLGIRLLYKGLKSREMEKKRIRKILKSLSIKQGKKYDDPNSASQIRDFINFHQLDMSEVLLPIEQFKTFNEFFYRKLKPDARPCTAPDEPRVALSPADCRSVVFNRMDDATKIWVKGREFSIERLLGDAYPEDAHRYRNGALGIFRLAPQDYHRFHIAVDGVMGVPKTIAGEYYTVNPMAIRSALDVYGENVRVLVPIDSAVFGRVMVVCVGAMMVGSTVITREAGEKVSRAEELGYFKFGGSTVLLLFEEGAIDFDCDLVGNSEGSLETLIRAGTSIGHHPSIPQFVPNLPKGRDNISMDEVQDAKRRIEGSTGLPAFGGKSLHFT